MTYKNKRLAIFLPTLDGGGAEKVTVVLANALASRGVKVDLVIASNEGVFSKDLVSDVTVIYLRVSRVFKAIIPLSHYIRDVKPEALIGVMTHANIVALAANMFSCSKTKIIASEHNTKSVERNSSFNEWLISKLIPFFYKKAYAVCTVSRAASNDLAKIINFPEKSIKTIYNPFDISHIESSVTEEVLHPWIIDKKNPVIIGIGRLTKQKDFSNLIIAFSKLIITRPAKLILLGDGELKDDLKLLVQKLNITESVNFLGFVKNPYSYLAKSDVFVLSSRWEGLPTVLIEALACGVPVVSTNCPSGPEEILDGGRFGKLVPVGDSDALSNAILEVLSSSDEYFFKGKKRALDFEKNKAVDAYLKITDFNL